MPSVLASSRLRRIVVAYGVNRLGTWFGAIALSLAIYDHTHSALAVAAVLVASQVVPGLVVPAVVARVEASPRRRELAALYWFEAALTAGLAVLIAHPWLPGVLLLVALDGTAALAASALLRTEAARAARNERLGGEDADASEQKMNAAINVAFSGTFVLGPALAGVIVAGSSASLALALDAASFLICGAMVLDLQSDVSEAGSESVRQRLRAAWAHIRSSAPLRTLLLAQTVALVFFESAAVIEVAYAKTSLSAGDRGYGLIVTCWGVGVVGGSILYARVGTKRLGTMLAAGTLLIGGAYVGFAAVPTLAAALAVAVVGGVGNGIQWAPVVGGVQRLTPKDLHARVTGALEALGALAPTVGFGLGGALVAIGNPRIAFVCVGVAAILTTGAFLRAGIDRAPPHDDDDDVASEADAPVDGTQHDDTAAPARVVNPS